jgi:hypothetical protein
LLLPSSFATKFLCPFIIFPMRATCPAFTSSSI